MKFSHNHFYIAKPLFRTIKKNTTKVHIWDTLVYMCSKIVHLYFVTYLLDYCHTDYCLYCATTGHIQCFSPSLDIMLVLEGVGCTQHNVRMSRFFLNNCWSISKILMFTLLLANTFTIFVYLYIQVCMLDSSYFLRSSLNPYTTFGHLDRQKSWRNGTSAKLVLPYITLSVCASSIE